MFYPTLKEPSQSREITQVFLGYDHNLRIADGAFYDTKNLTADYYPILSQRGKRYIVETLTNSQGMLGKDALAWVENNHLYYNGYDLTSYFTAKGLSIASGAKQMVSMGAYICIFPDHLYLNTQDFDDCGSMENTATINAATSNVTLSVCKMDGTGYDSIATTEPASPANGDVWLDISATPHTLKQYSATTSMWVPITTTYVKIAAAGIGVGFNQYDGVTISGLAAGEGDVATQVAALNATSVVQAREDGYIVLIGLIDAITTQSTGTVTVSRTVPPMDYVTECNNRLWGCYYGVTGGKSVNEIYCCKLGDFKNWRCYYGVSTDSFAASVGTDGRWTGAITFGGYPLFFKENCVHKVYVSSSGAHQIQDTAMRGVERGSFRSLAIVDGTLYYKSTTSIMAFDGSGATDIGSAFGGIRYHDAVGGGIGSKYYVSMKDDQNNYAMFVYDAAKGVWMKEDDIHAICFANVEKTLYFMDSDNRLVAVGEVASATAETDFEWEAVSGVMGYNDPDKKYLSRYNLRMELGTGAYIELFLQYDSDGVWRPCGAEKITGIRGTFTLPVRPRRCDHMQMKIRGKGEIKLYSIARIYEGGSDL